MFVRCMCFEKTFSLFPISNRFQEHDEIITTFYTAITIDGSCLNRNMRKFRIAMSQMDSNRRPSENRSWAAQRASHFHASGS